MLVNRRIETVALAIAGVLTLSACATVDGQADSSSSGDAEWVESPEALVPGPVTEARIAEQCERIVDDQIAYAPRAIRERMTSPGVPSAGQAPDEADPASAMDDEWEGSRPTAIAQSAFRLGAQWGMHWRYQHIVALLESDELAPVLARTFDFSRMVSTDNVLYPVISQTQRAFAVDREGAMARTSRVAWEIMEPARIVSTPPQWQSYLYQTTEAPSGPSEGLMPWDEAEMERWAEGVCEGFEAGVEQAETIYGDRLKHLVRDYEGMIRYRVLVEQNVVGEPVVDEGRMGIQTDSGDQRLRVDERMIRITNPAAFDPDGEAWQAIESLAPPAADDSGENGETARLPQGWGAGDDDGWW